MKEYAAANIRNIALVGHQDSGKTVLAEAMLFVSGAIGRLGKIEDGNTTMDSTPEENERQISIHSGIAWCEHRDCKINIIDTPGYEDFVGEVVYGLDVADSAILALRADGGVEVGTDRALEMVRERGLPVMCVINKMDKEHADFDNCLGSLQEAFGAGVRALQIPIGQGESFKGVVDLVTNKAHMFSTDGKGGVQVVDVPDDLASRVEELRGELMETAAEADESLMNKYFETGELTHEEFFDGLGRGVRSGDVIPVLVASPINAAGVKRVLDAITAFMPSPEGTSRLLADGETLFETDAKAKPAAFIFKNTNDPHVGDMLFLRAYGGAIGGGSDIYNTTRDHAERLGQLCVVKGKHRDDVAKVAAGDIGAVVKLKATKVGDTLADKGAGTVFKKPDLPNPSIFSAISPAAKGDEDKMGTGLNRLRDEDPSFSVEMNAETHQTLISGQGELHLEVVTHKLKERFGVSVNLDKPRIPYRETISKMAEAQGRHKKQTGGRGQFGDAWLRIEPLPRGEQFEFVDAIVGGVIPGKFIPAVEKGVVATMERGVIAGYRMVDIKATVYDGSYHSVDSSEQAFKTAGTLAFKAAVEKAGPKLLEPIVNVSVKVPEEFMGDVMGDLSGRRGKIQGTEMVGKFAVVNAQVPQAELYRYSTHLRSMTQGRGHHKREFSHYEEVPHELTAKIIEESKAEKEA